MSQFESYWPMDEGPGANSGVLRWRKMARLWAHDGVVRGFGLELWPQYYDPASAIWVVGTGAVWVNGFYGEITANKQLSVPGNRGLVVARMDPRWSTVALAFADGRDWPVQDPDGVWEVPLHWLPGDGTWADRRPFVQPGKGLAELPPHVPRRGHFVTGPPTAIDVAINGAIFDTWMELVPGWQAGRAYRVSAGIGGVNTPGPGAAPETLCELAVYSFDLGQVVRAQRLFGPLTLVNDAVAAGWTSFTLVNAVNCHVTVTYRGGGGSPPPLRVPAHACWLEVQDLGTA